MALSKKNALDAAKAILDGARAQELPRLERIANAMRPFPKGDALRVEVPKDAPEMMKRLAAKAETNYMPLVVDTFSQIMKVDGYFAEQGVEAGAWGHWQRNGMDARQTGVHRAGLGYGASYVKVLPGDTGPVMRGRSPRALTAVYANPADDDWPMFALEVDGSLLSLYDEEMEYRFGLENMPRSGLADVAASVAVAGGQLTFLEPRAHGAQVCPIVRFRDRMLLEGEEQFGIVEPLLTLQDRINETTFGMLVAQFYAAFKQRYVIGWVPKSEQEALKASAATLWTFEDSPDDVKVGELAETDLTRYIESKASAIRDLAAIGQLPAQALGVDGVSNISAEALAGLEAAKDRKADEITTSFGESWEQALRLCAFYAGDEAGAGDFGSEVRWADASARSFAQTVDGLGKLATMLNVPQEILWEQIPGWTQQTVERAKTLAAEGNALGNLTALLDQQAPPALPAA